MHFTWPPNDFTLMWLQIAVGFTGALTLSYFVRSLLRRLGAVPDLRVYFSPRGGCQDSLVQELQKARREILVQAFSFTADPLTYALVDAKKRGVDVQVLLDKSNETDRYSDLKILPCPAISRQLHEAQEPLQAGTAPGAQGSLQG